MSSSDAFSPSRDADPSRDSVVGGAVGGAPPPPSTHQRVHVAAAHGATVAASDESTARSPGAHRPLASRETPHAELTHPKGAAASAAARGRDAKAQGHTRREG